MLETTWRLTSLKMDSNMRTKDQDQDHVFVVTRANHHAKPYEHPIAQPGPEDEHEEILKDMRAIRRQQQMDVDKKPRHTAAQPQPQQPATIPFPLSFHQNFTLLLVSNSSTKVHAPQHGSYKHPILKD